MPSQPYIDLAAVLSLPPVDELDAVLCAARLPVDERSRMILGNGFLRIRHECAVWKADRQRPDLGKAFGEISEAVSGLLRFLVANDGRRQAVSIIESGTVWNASPRHPAFQTLAALQDAALFYNRLYRYKQETRKLHTEYDNFVYERLYRLLGEIKGSRPGNTYLLYNFTMSCVELLRIEVNPVTPGAFRMRIARMLQRQRKGLGSLADLFRDLPPVRFDQLSGEEFATFGNMAAIVSDLPLMAYWAAPKRRRNKRSHSTSRVANQTRDPSDDDRS